MQPIARRKSLNPPEEVVRTLPIRDNLFSNLSRARRDPDAVSTVNNGNNGYSNGNNHNSSNDNRADSGGSGSNGRRGSGMGVNQLEKAAAGAGEKATPLRRGSSQTNGSISSNEGDRNKNKLNEIPSEKSDRSDKNDKTLKNDKNEKERPEKPEKPILSAKARAVRRGSFIAPPPVDGRKVSLPRLSVPHNAVDKVDRGDRGESKGEKNEKGEKVLNGERGERAERVEKSDRAEKNEKHKETEVSQSVRLTPSSLPAIKKEKEKERRKSIQL